jgi:hypothetical protein
MPNKANEMFLVFFLFILKTINNIIDNITPNKLALEDVEISNRTLEIIKDIYINLDIIFFALIKHIYETQTENNIKVA